MKSKEEKLFIAVAKGQTRHIETLLEQGVSVNARSKEDGNTPLLVAAKCRNYVVQSLLLSKGAKPNTKNTETGQTPLHYIAESGDVESMKLLLAMQGDINISDYSGYTPLHYSVDRNRTHAADLLVFCGANAFKSNHMGISPFMLAKNDAMMNILEESALITEGIANGEICINHAELTPDTTVYLPDIDVEIHTPKLFSANSLSFLCRRIRPEYSSMKSLLPSAREFLISDTFEYRKSLTHLHGLVRISVPLYAQPDPYEDVYLKTTNDAATIAMYGPVDRKVEIYRDERAIGILKWKCDVYIDISKTTAFVLVTLPRVERFAVGPSGGTFYSEVDKFLQIKVRPDTFESGDVSLEVIPSPIYKQEKLFQEVFAVGHFYDLNHSDGISNFQNDGVEFIMPVPGDFEGNGELCILTAHLTSDFDFEDDIDKSAILDTWEIIKRDVNPKRGKLSCTLSHFSICVPMEMGWKTTDHEKKITAHAMFERSCRRINFVKFFTMSRPLPEFYEVVVECTPNKKMNDRKTHWQNMGFIMVDENNMSCETETKDRQRYTLELDKSSNIKKRMENIVKLHFHAKRENFIQFPVDIIDEDRHAYGYISVSTEIEEEEDDDVVASFPIQLQKSQDTSSNIMDSGFKGFLRDSLLKTIAQKLGTPQWIQVCIFLGFSFHTIDEYRSQPTTLKSPIEIKILKILRKWRDRCSNRDNCGVPDLVVALNRVHRNDLVEIIMKELDKWLNSREDSDDAFCRWARNTFNRSTVEDITEEEVVPMSDTFLILLVNKYGGQQFKQLGYYMDLFDNQISNVFSDSTIPGIEMKYVRIMIMARDKIGNDLEAFNKLLDALESCELMEAKTWVIESAKSWCNTLSLESTDDVHSKLKADIGKCLRHLDGNYSDNDSEERDSDERQDTVTSSTSNVRAESSRSRSSSATQAKNTFEDTTNELETNEYHSNEQNQSLDEEDYTKSTFEY